MVGGKGGEGGASESLKSDSVHVTEAMLKELRAEYSFLCCVLQNESAT